MIILELTIATTSETHWAIIQESVDLVARGARRLTSAGSDARGRLEYRLHLTRGAMDSASWRRAVATLAALAEEEV